MRFPQFSSFISYLHLLNLKATQKNQKKPRSWFTKHVDNVRPGFNLKVTAWRVWPKGSNTDFSRERTLQELIFFWTLCGDLKDIAGRITRVWNSVKHLTVNFWLHLSFLTGFLICFWRITNTLKCGTEKLRKWNVFTLSWNPTSFDKKWLPENSKKIITFSKF